MSTISYDIKSVAVNGSGQPEIKFTITKDGVAVTSLAVPNLVTNAATGQQVVDPNYEPIAGFAAGPSFYAAYAVPQDGIAAPADFNASSNVSLANLLVAVGERPAGVVAGDCARD